MKRNSGEFFGQPEQLAANQTLQLQFRVFPRRHDFQAARLGDQDLADLQHSELFQRSRERRGEYRCAPRHKPH